MSRRLVPQRTIDRRVQAKPLRVTCFVEFDRVQKGSRSIGLCGEWVDEIDISGEPTCAGCRAELAKTAAEVFGL